MIAATLGIIAALWLAQSPARDARPPGVAASETASITGVVLDVDGKPLNRAVVTVAGEAGVPRTLMSDDRGAFAATGLPTGRYTIAASKGGYARATYGAARPNRPGTSVALADAQHVTGITLTLMRGGVITGRIIDEDGQPLPGAQPRLSILRVSPSGERQLRPVPGAQSPTTDDRGVFRFYGLAPGDYIAAVMFSPVSSARLPTDAEIRAAFERAKSASSTSPPGVPPSPSSELVNFAQIYYGDTADPATSTPIAVTAGETSTIEIRMRRTPMASIVATVMSPDGPVTSAETWLVKNVFNAGASGVPANKNGQFEFRELAPAGYTLIARYTAPDGRMLVASETVAAASGVNAVTLALQPATSMTGRVVFRGSQAPPGAGSAQIMLEHTDHALWFNRIAPPKVAPDGTFVAEGMMPGRYRATASVHGAPQWILESIVVGGRDVTDVGLESTSGAPVEAVFTFTDVTSGLSGVLQNASGLPAPEYYVAVFAADESLWSSSRRLSFARPDTSGRYTFAGLPPGDYRLAVTTDMEKADLTDIAFLRALVPESLALTIAAGEQKKLDVRVK